MRMTKTTRRQWWDESWFKVFVFFMVLSAISSSCADAAENPDFPGGQAMALEVGQTLDTDRDVPADRLWAELLVPAGKRMTLTFGVQVDKSTSRVEDFLNPQTDRRTSMRWSARFYFGGGQDAN